MGKITENPVFIKELRVGLREKKILSAIIAFLLLFSIIAFLLFKDAINSLEYQSLGEIGFEYFMALSITQALLITLIIPSFTSSSISGEVENLTYDLMKTSLLEGRDIISGKIAYAASITLMMQFISLPLVSLAFLVGGVHPFVLITMNLLLFFWGILVGMTGIYFSARSSRSMAASILTYLFLGSVIYLMIKSSSEIYDLFTEFFSQDHSHILSFAYHNVIPASLFMGLISLSIFLYYKAANYIDPRLKNAVSLHRLFLVCFSIFFLIIEFYFFTELVSWHPNHFISGFEKHWQWLIFKCTFAMIFFIEQRKYHVKDEKASRSLTLNRYFFPAYFSGIMIISGLCSALLHFYFIKSATPAVLISVVLGISCIVILTYITNLLFNYMDGKIRPVFVMVLFLLVMNSNLISIKITDYFVHGYNKPIYSFPELFNALINPAFAIIPTWNPQVFYEKFFVSGNTFPFWLISLLLNVLFMILLKNLLDYAKKKKEKSGLKLKKEKEKALSPEVEDLPMPADAS
jgi:ABC-2 type transport system permease protein